MIGYDLYRIYEPIRLHFETTYDVFKYKAKTKAITRDKFETRKDKYIFEKVANRLQSPKTAGQVCLANFVYNNRDWLYHEYSEISEVYHRWKGNLGDVRSNFSDQVDKLVTIAKENGITAERMFEKTPSGKYPPALQLFMHGRVYKETIAILSYYKDFIETWVADFDHDPLVSDQLFLLKKYQPFIITRENQKDFYEAARLIFRADQIRIPRPEEHTD